MFEMQQITFVDRLAVGTVGKQWSIHIARERDAVLEIRLGDKWKRVCRTIPCKLTGLSVQSGLHCLIESAAGHRGGGYVVSADTFLHDY